MPTARLPARMDRALFPVHKTMVKAARYAPMFQRPPHIATGGRGEGEAGCERNDRLLTRAARNDWRTGKYCIRRTWGNDGFRVQVSGNGTRFVRYFGVLHLAAAIRRHDCRRGRHDCLLYGLGCGARRFRAQPRAGLKPGAG